MTQADSNRARFFPRGQDSNSSTNLASASENSLSVFPAVSNVAATSHAMVTSTLNSTNSNEDDIIAQRTCMIETETLFKPRKDRNGKLNLSGLIKENKKPRDIMPSATITEITDKGSEISQDSNVTFSNVGNTSLALKPSRTLNVQGTAFVPSNLNVLAISDITVETPVNKKPFNVKESSRGDHLTSNEPLGLSGNQHNSFQPGDYMSATTLCSVMGTKNSPLGSTMNKITAGPQDKQYALMTSYSDIRNPGFLAEANDLNGKCPQRNREKRRNDTGEAQLPDSVVAKKRKKNNGVGQTNSSPESYVSRSTDERETVVSTHSPPSSSLATVLGRDIENYIASHIDEYGRAKARWTECPREEWEQGALEIAARFTQILDFVKDHMRHKIMLYANLQAKLDDHRSVRDNIAGMLKEAKNELVTKTGGLIDEGKSG